jgi:invasion protein IalB
MKKSAISLWLLASVAAVTVHAADAEKVSTAFTFGDWAVMTDEASPHLFCFVTSAPKSSAPSDAQREAPRAYVTAWPKDGIRAEVSFRMGFAIKKASPATATVAPANFKLFGAGDRVYVSDATRELKLVEAMRKGSALSVVALTGAGAPVTDTYSLNGLGQALQKLQETCF